MAQTSYHRVPWIFKLKPSEISPINSILALGSFKFKTQTIFSYKWTKLELDFQNVVFMLEYVEFFCE